VTALTTFTDQFKVWDGITDVTTGRGVVYSVLSQTGCAVAIDASTGAITMSAVSADTASATFRAVYGANIIDKVFSVAKARAGALGVSAKLLSLICDRQTISHDATGSLSPSTQTTTFTVFRQNTTATPVWTATDLAGTAITAITSLLTVDTGGGSISATMTGAAFDAGRGITKGVIVSATITDGSVFSDKISVMSVADGATGSAGSAGANGAGAFSLVNVANMLISSPVEVTALGSGSRWTSKARTAESHIGATVTGFGPATAECMIGLTTDPTVDSSYASIDYALYHNGAGGFNLYRNGSGSASYTDPAYSSSTPMGPMTVTSDGQNVRYSVKGIDLPSFAHAVNATNEQLFGSFALGDAGPKITGISYSAVGARGATGVAGRDAMVFYQNSTASPVSPITGDTWYQPDTKKWFRWSGTSWLALLGSISQFDQINSTSIAAGVIAAGAIGAGQITVGSLDALTANIGLLRTATSGARLEIQSNVIRVYDSSNVLRVKIGDLS
jgi:hypothetical protein